MKPAAAPRERREQARMLVAHRGQPEVELSTAEALARFLNPGDLLVLNDAASFPAALHTEDGTLEARLLGALEGARAQAVLLGPGDWRQRTEDRLAPRAVRPHERLRFRGGLTAHVDEVYADSPRHVLLHFELTGAELFRGLYRAGRPVQYSYLAAPLSLWDVQTTYASRPWAAEMPSAGAVLSFGVLKSLRERGVELATLTHAAGLSSTGDAALDARLPLIERYEVPAETVEAIARTQGRVIAVGTTVVRALEGAFQDHGSLRAGAGETNLHLGPGYQLHVVDGLLTGVHDPTASHFALLHAFADAAQLQSLARRAESFGLLGHEFGDVCLLLP